MSVTGSAPSTSRSGVSWDAALDRLEAGLDRIEPRLAALGADGADGAVILGPAPAVDGDLPEHLADRARGLLARTDALASRVAGELSRIERAQRDLSHRVPDRQRHPAFVDTRA